MTRDELNTEAFSDFLIGLPVMMDKVNWQYSLDDMWAAFLAGRVSAQKVTEYEEEIDPVDGGENKAKVAETPVPDDSEKPLPFTCGRCPNPKKPDPKFHPNGGLAHIVKRPGGKTHLIDDCFPIPYPDCNVCNDSGYEVNPEKWKVKGVRCHRGCPVK